MIDNLTGSNLQPAIIGALIASVTALAVSLLTWLSTSRQVRVSRDTLFVSLLPRRHEWLDKFRTAVTKRKRHLPSGKADSAFFYNDQNEPNRIIIHESILSAEWLFDKGISQKAQNINEKLQEYITVIHRETKNKAEVMDAFDDTRSIEYALISLMDELISLCVPYLYVGDVKRPASLPTRLRSTAKRLAKTIRARFAPEIPPEN